MFLLCLGYVSAAVTYSSQAFVGTSVTGDAEDTGNFIRRVALSISIWVAPRAKASRT